MFYAFSFYCSLESKEEIFQIELHKLLTFTKQSPFEYFFPIAKKKQ